MTLEEVSLSVIVTNPRAALYFYLKAIAGEVGRSINEKTLYTVNESEFPFKI